MIFVLIFSGLQLFHQAVLMDGSDLCEWSYVGSVWNANPVTYTRDLSRLVGCSGDYDQNLDYIVQCLRGKHFDEIVNASASVYKRVSSSMIVEMLMMLYMCLSHITDWITDLQYKDWL